jgi:excisionase family DNA binding protein
MNKALKHAIVDSERTQRAIARRTRIDETRLSRIVKGELTATDRERAKLARHLQRPVSELFPEVTRVSLERVQASGELATSVPDLAPPPKQSVSHGHEAVDYLRLGSESALYRLVREHGLPNLRRGRLYLFDTREIDAWLRGANSALELVRAHKRRGAR